MILALLPALKAPPFSSSAPPTLITARSPKTLGDLRAPPSCYTAPATTPMGSRPGAPQCPGVWSLVLTTSPGVKYCFSRCTGKATKIYSLHGDTLVFISKNSMTTTLFSWVLRRRDTEEDTKLSRHPEKTGNGKQP